MAQSFKTFKLKRIFKLKYFGQQATISTQWLNTNHPFYSFMYFLDIYLFIVVLKKYCKAQNTERPYLPLHYILPEHCHKLHTSLHDLLSFIIIYCNCTLLFNYDKRLNT